jgi:hypothetical protein
LTKLDPKINYVISFFIMSALLNLALIGATARTINAALARYPIPAGHCPAWSEAFSSSTKLMRVALL